MELVKPRAALKSGAPTSGLFVLVGNPKSGKTTFMSSFPDSYILELEPGGADRVGGRIHEIGNLADFREVLKAAIAEPSIKTIGIDTVDVVSDWIEDEVAKAAGLETISETKKGVDGFELWAAFRQKMEMFTAYCKASGKLVILSAHCREPKLDKSGTLLTPAGINVPGKSGSYLAAQADIIGYAYKKVVGPATEYYLTFQGGPLGMWGSRVDELNDKTLKLPKGNGYGAFEAVFQTPAPTANGHEPEKVEKKKLAKAGKEG